MDINPCKAGPRRVNFDPRKAGPKHVDAKAPLGWAKGHRRRKGREGKEEVDRCGFISAPNVVALCDMSNPNSLYLV